MEIRLEPGLQSERAEQDLRSGGPGASAGALLRGRQRAAGHLERDQGVDRNYREFRVPFRRSRSSGVLITSAIC